MDDLDVIRAAHAIDQSLGQLACAAKEATLRNRIVAVQAEWKEIAYQIAAEICGFDGAVPRPTTRRGRRRRAEESGDGATGGQAS